MSLGTVSFLFREGINIYEKQSSLFKYTPKTLIYLLDTYFLHAATIITQSYF